MTAVLGRPLFLNINGVGTLSCHALHLTLQRRGCRSLHAGIICRCDMDIGKSLQKARSRRHPRYDTPCGCKGFWGFTGKAGKGFADGSTGFSV
jgi:hypothetical protein